MKHCLVCGAFIEARDFEWLKSTEDTEVIKAVVPRHGSKIYRMVEKPRGICLIINNIASEDMVNISSLFTQLHFEVHEKTNLTAGDMLLELVRASYAEELQWTDCLVVILRSHGTEHVVCGTDGKALHLDRHVYPLFNDANCSDFQGKPKLFFVQTCDSSQPPSTLEDEPKSLASQGEQGDSKSSWCDMYCAHSTIRGFVPFKDIETTPWFLPVVDSIFRKNAGRTHLDVLMDLVSNWIQHRSVAQKQDQTLKIQRHEFNRYLYFNPGF